MLVHYFQVYHPSQKKVVTARHCQFIEDDLDIPKISDPSDPGPACMACKSKDEVYPSKILLCDCTGCPHCNPSAETKTSTCDEAWHMSCLPEPLYRLPRGDWVCPNYKIYRQPPTSKRSQAAWEMTSTSLPPLDAVSDLNKRPVILDNPQSESAYEAPASKRGRIRRQPVRYNPVFLALAVFDNIFHTTFSTSFVDPPTPQNLKEALDSPEAADWEEAIVAEVISLLEKGTFEVMDKPDKATVKTKWVFKRKVDAFGNFIKYKARLVAKGFLQKFGVDYFDVFSPVTKLSTLRVLLSHVAANDLELRHVDVCTACC